MAKAKKKKYSASDKAILGIGYVLLGAFVLSILVPLLYVVIASFMDPNVLNSQGIRGSALMCGSGRSMRTAEFLKII